MKVKLLKLNTPDYPEILSQIPSAPKQLYWLGASPVELLARPKIAIVGSRKATPYGRQVTQDLTTKLVHVGVVIVSGLALGIDSIAHRAALDAGGLTLAVLPSSLDNIYPPSHRGLAEAIIQNGGALASEYAGHMEGFASNFIARNRIVSGLADGLLITEAAAASGTMHTARFALEQGKTVMAVPGNITSQISEGCNNLIKAGATPVTSVDDIFFALKLKPQKPTAKKLFRGSELEQLVFKLIADGVADQEDIALQSSLGSAELSSTLTMLELSGHIKPVGAGNWVVI